MPQLTETTPTATTTESKPSKQAYKPCGCFVLTGPTSIQVGCGGHTKSRYMMGHDAKTKSVLQHLFRTVGPDAVIQVTGLDNVTIGRQVSNLFAELGWLQFMTPGKVNKANSAIAPMPVVDLPESELDGPAAPAQPIPASTQAVTETTKTHTPRPAGARRRSRSAA
jgi:hypothetical protein